LCIAIVVAIFFVIQTGSEALYAQPNTVSSFVPHSVGVSVYETLDRVAPMAFVDEGLAADAIAHGDLDRAQHFAERLKSSGRRDDLLGQVAQARGNARLASDYFFAAPDVDRMQQTVRELAKHDPASAYALELRFEKRLEALQTHPDAVAESYFIAGNLAERLHRGPESFASYQHALDLAPLNLKYIVGTGIEAYLLKRNADARRLYQRGLEVNPACGDCLGGLGVLALQAGNRAIALQYEKRARAVDPSSGMLAELERELK
jgi:tetratricopeptide (TPR) repeat protein